jgi:hypothetical protein
VASVIRETPEAGFEMALKQALARLAR